MKAIFACVMVMAVAFGCASTPPIVQNPDCPAANHDSEPGANHQLTVRFDYDDLGRQQVVQVFGIHPELEGPQLLCTLDGYDEEITTSYHHPAGFDAQIRTVAMIEHDGEWVCMGVDRQQETSARFHRDGVRIYTRHR